LHTSKRIFDLLREFSPRVEPASIDEAYLAVEDDQPEVLGARVQLRMEEVIGLTASLGISESRCLAKVASSMRKPRGLTFLPLAKVEEVLWPLPVSTLPGVGAKTAARLAGFGLSTVGDLARSPEADLVRVLGMHAASLRRRARGEDSRRVVTPEEAPDAKSIGHERTLEQDEYDRSRLEALVCFLVQKVGRRARRYHMAGRRVVLKLRDRHFHTITRGRVLPAPVDADDVILRVAKDLLAETRFWERGVRLAGVSLQMLVDVADSRQLAFEFESKPQRALPVVDQIRTKHGESAIGLARALESERDPDEQRITFTPPR
jgi:DNA polymerase-4